MTIEEYRAAILQALLDTKNEDGTPAITPREAQEALNGADNTGGATCFSRASSGHAGVVIGNHVFY